MARRWRVHHPKLSGQPGELVELSSAETHHARRVLRLVEGTELGLFDGKGREWLATIVDLGGTAVRVRVERPLLDPVEAPVSVTLYQAACRPERMEWVVQKATEIGVAAIGIVHTERCDAPPTTPRRLERWQRIAVEAAKQSGRRRIPTLELCERLPVPGAEPGVALLLDSGPDARPIGALLAGLSPRSVWLAVGPESGLSHGERSALVAEGWQAADLGPRILRTETAGPVALALVLHVWGDLGPGRGPGG